MTGSMVAPLNEAEAPRWSDEADLVIAGFGMAGACAALEARALGADALILERASGSGGTTSFAAGHFYLGGGTPVQRATGFTDTAENMYRYLKTQTPEPVPEKLRLYCEESVAHFDWLEAQGVPFDRSYYSKKAVVQPTRECLIWSGNEAVWPFREEADPVPRGHKVACDGEEGGGALAMAMLTKRAAEIGVRSRCDTAVQALIRDEKGAIIGVKARHLEETLFIRARRGVMLATGGFGMNAEMVKRYVPALAPPFYVQGSPYDDGSGILMGVGAGAALRHMDSPFVTSPFYPPEQLLKGILVNKRGERFVAEDSYHGRTGAFSMAQPGGIVYLILDSEIFDYPAYAKLTNQALRDGWDSIEEMEAGLDLPKGSLTATLEAHNDAAARGEDPAFHKHPKWLKPLDKPPYAAFDLSIGRAIYTGFTLGGLSVSIDAEVLRTDDTPIPGLYAAGACASNIAQDSRGYASGTCLGEASFFGRRGGRHAAQHGR